MSIALYHPNFFNSSRLPGTFLLTLRSIGALGPIDTATVLNEVSQCSSLPLKSRLPAEAQRGPAPLVGPGVSSGVDSNLMKSQVPIISGSSKEKECKITNTKSGTGPWKGPVQGKVLKA